MNWDKYIGHETAVVVALAELRDSCETIEAALASYDAWMAERMADMIPATPEARARAAGAVGAARGVELGPGEEIVGPCPKCGGPTIGKRLCPHVSPHWRTQLACADMDACGWHAVSTHTPGWLRRRGLSGNVANEAVA